MPADNEIHEAIAAAVDRIADRLDKRLDTFGREASESRTRLHARFDAFGAEFRGRLDGLSTQVTSLKTAFDSHERYDRLEHDRVDKTLDAFAEKLEAAEREGKRESHGWLRTIFTVLASTLAGAVGWLFGRQT